MESSLSTDESSATEDEDDFAILLRKRREAAEEEEDAPASDRDTSVVEVREEERDGYTRSGPSRRDLKDDSRNNNDLERDLKRLQDQMDRMTREKDMATAVIENLKLMVNSKGRRTSRTP